MIFKNCFNIMRASVRPCMLACVRLSEVFSLHFVWWWYSSFQWIQIKYRLQDSFISKLPEFMSRNSSIEVYLVLIRTEIIQDENGIIFERNYLSWQRIYKNSFLMAERKRNDKEEQRDCTMRWNNRHIYEKASTHTRTQSGEKFVFFPRLFCLQSVRRFLREKMNKNKRSASNSSRICDDISNAILHIHFHIYAFVHETRVYLVQFAACIDETILSYRCVASEQQCKRAKSIKRGCRIVSSHYIYP